MTTKGDRLGADDSLRQLVAHLPIPDLEPAFTVPPPLGRARVAIVTTAGLMRHGEEAWTHDDADFRVFESDERDLMVGHVSMSRPGGRRRRSQRRLPPRPPDGAGLRGADWRRRAAPHLLHGRTARDP